MNTKIITQIIETLAKEDSQAFLFHKHRDGDPLPSIDDIRRIVDLVRACVFPGYFGSSCCDNKMLRYHIGLAVEQLYLALKMHVPDDIALKFVEWLPVLRNLLATDVRAIYDGDPAASTYEEVISCYPSIRAVSNYRMAHKLLELGVSLVPRIMTELAHSETGIDIHPGAKIGPYFAIDHGTGVVIGETCIIGSHVKLYQGVTLGAKSFPLDPDGNPIKGIDRHPILEDDVIVYANATILGRVTIGRGAIIGGNQWVTTSVAPGTILT